MTMIRVEQNVKTLKIEVLRELSRFQASQGCFAASEALSDLACWHEEEQLIQLMHHTGPNHYDDEWFRGFENEASMTLRHVHTANGRWSNRPSMNIKKELFEKLWLSDFKTSFAAIKTAH